MTPVAEEVDPPPIYTPSAQGSWHRWSADTTELRVRVRGLAKRKTTFLLKPRTEPDTQEAARNDALLYCPTSGCLHVEEGDVVWTPTTQDEALLTLTLSKEDYRNSVHVEVDNTPSKADDQEKQLILRAEDAAARLIRFRFRCANNHALKTRIISWVALRIDVDVTGGSIALQRCWAKEIRNGTSASRKAELLQAVDGDTGLADVTCRDGAHVELAKLEGVNLDLTFEKCPVAPHLDVDAYEKCTITTNAADLLILDPKGLRVKELLLRTSGSNKIKADLPLLYGNERIDAESEAGNVNISLLLSKDMSIVTRSGHIKADVKVRERFSASSIKHDYQVSLRTVSGKLDLVYGQGKRQCQVYSHVWRQEGYHQSFMRLDRSETKAKILPVGEQSERLEQDFKREHAVSILGRTLPRIL